MISGALVFVLASVAYGWTAGAPGLVLVRLLHGAGMGLYPTAASAMVADVTPPQRRGEVLGFYGAAGSIAMAVGPITGMALVGRFDFSGLFWIAGAVAAMALVMTLTVDETLAQRARRAVDRRQRDQRRRPLPLAGHAVLDVHVRHPGGVPALARRHARREPRRLLPGLRGDDHGGARPGRSALGSHRAGADRRGRAPAGGRRARRAGAQRERAGLALAGAIYGAAYGRRSRRSWRGAWTTWPTATAARAMGTFYSALEIGIAIGAMSSGLAVARWGFTGTFLATAGVAIAGAGLALTRTR